MSFVSENSSKSVSAWCAEKVKTFNLKGALIALKHCMMTASKLPAVSLIKFTIVPSDPLEQKLLELQALKSASEKQKEFEFINLPEQGDDFHEDEFLR
jgi:hypothetical protein